MRSRAILAGTASLLALLVAAAVAESAPRLHKSSETPAEKRADQGDPRFPRASAEPQRKVATKAAEAPAELPPAPVPVMRLRSEAIVHGDIVRLSDLIDGLDKSRDLPMFKAPALGEIGTIQSARIVNAAAEIAVTGIDTHDLTAVIVRRAAHVVPQEQLFDMARDQLVQRYGLPPETEIVPEKGTRPMIVEAEARRSPEIQSFTYDPRLNRFDVSFIVPGSAVTAKSPYRLGGSLGETIRVPIVVRQLSKGDTVSEADISVETRKRSEFFGDGLVDPAKVVGQVARHAMHVGDILAAGDIQRAQWVDKGSLVTLIYETSNMSLSTKGRALADGAQGETVSVENLQSKRTIEGTIVGPGRVSVRNRAVETARDVSLADQGPTRTALAGAPSR